MPALSPTMTEGNLVKWHKKVGDAIKSGDLLAEIETDKATMEVEAVDEGVFGKILVNEGTENVAVNTCIGLILEDGENASLLDAYTNEKQAAPAQKNEDAHPPRKEAETSSSQQTNVIDATIEENASQERVFASPLAKRLAAERSLDLTRVSGSGPRGRIIKRDIENFVPEAIEAVSGVSTLPALHGPLYEDKAPSNMRKVIARRLLESKQTIPHFYLTIDVVLDKLLETRKTLNESLENEKITVNDFVIKAIALALRDVPDANTAWLGDKIRYFKHADIAVAVAIEDGLITPILKAADLKSIRHISAEMKSLAAKARDGKLKPEEFQGGSFSLSNLGMFGVREFSAIINPPQTCILAVGKGEERAIVQNGAVVVRNVLSCTLSSDHRVVDGKVGALFLDAFKKYLENPLLMMA